MPDRAELAAWLRLLETPGLGRASLYRLLRSLGSAQAVFDAPAAALQSLLSGKQEQALREEPEHLPELIARTWDWLQADARHQILLLGEADYPAALLQITDPPPLLYLRGRRELLAQPCLAIVGSRSPTPQGRDNAEAFGRALSQAGLTVVSGLALGVDGAAHQGALEGAGSTIAVVGTGLDQAYPLRHRKLTEDIAEHGLVLSEYPLGMPPLAPNFPRRNRIIAGLSQGCLVVEAALKSGSLITARLASEAGREVFAIPGSIHSAQSQGCHALIREGAKLVERPEDVLDELPPLAAAAPTITEAASTDPDHSSAEQRVLELMGYDPVSLDALQARGGWSAAELSALLLDLELSGAVARLAGALFQRRTLA